LKRNWLTYLVIFSLALNLGTMGTIFYLRHQAQTDRVAGPGPGPMPLRSLWRELNMDKAQRQALHQLFPEHYQKVRALRQELTQRRQELFNLIKEESTPMSAIRAKIQEISALQGSLEEEMAHFMMEFKKNLDPTQYAAFLNLVQTRLGCGEPCGPGEPGRGGGRRGPGLGPRNGPMECPSEQVGK
jgi:Spy/CpxP family protein refolding chaperone